MATLNPKREGLELAPTALVHFVPMAAVKEAFGGVDVSTTRPLFEVVKGYTVFRTHDVIMAKITPCMENGKLAVIPHLEHGWAFGSTEFHVLRSTEAVRPSWLAHFLSQTDKRRDAQRAMTGSAGQLRVPLTWIAEQIIPIAPLSEQDRIVAKIDELVSDLDAGVAALERVRANLKRYRAAVLKAAVAGRLTEEWRTASGHRTRVCQTIQWRRECPIRSERRSPAEAEEERAPKNKGAKKRRFLLSSRRLELGTNFKSRCEGKWRNLCRTFRYNFQGKRFS